jgi:transcriptional regulator with XRE-family HTH domain
MSSTLDKIATVAYNSSVITPAQIRGARAMLGLNQAELARRAGISATGLNNIERGDADPKASTIKAVQDVLDSLGVDFTNGGAPGVKLRRPKGEFMSEELFGLLIQRFDRGDFAHLSKSLEERPAGRPPEKLHLTLGKSRATLHSNEAEIGRVDLEKGSLVFSPPLPGNYPSQVDIGKLWDWTMESWRRHNAIAELPRIVGLSALAR